MGTRLETVAEELSEPAPAVDSAVLDALKRQLKVVGLRFAEVRQVEQGELAPALLGVARRQRRYGRLLVVLAAAVLVLFAFEVVAWSARPPEPARFLETPPPIWMTAIVRCFLVATWGWLARRCLRRARVLRAAGERCAAGTLDPEGALREVLTSLGGDVAPVRS